MTKAQAEFIKQDVLNQLGGQYDTLNPNAYPILERILMQSGLDFNRQIGINLKKNNTISTGALLDVEIPMIKYLGNTCVLEIGYAADSKQAKYYDFVDKGVKGTKNEKADNNTKYKFKSSKKSIPVDVVKGWLSTKGSKSFSVKKYRKLGVEKTPTLVQGAEQAPYIIAKSIHRKGLKSTHYFSDALKLIFDNKFKEALQVALGADINIKIRQTINSKLK